MKFKPIGKRALVKPVEQAEKTASGIVLPETAKEKPQIAKVVAVGDCSWTPPTSSGSSKGSV